MNGESRRPSADPSGSSDDEPLCRCYRVTRVTILDAVRRGALKTVEEVTRATGAAGGCSSCYDDVQELLDREHGVVRARPAGDPLSDSDKREIILRTVDQLVRKVYEINGVDLHVLGVEGDRVFARLRGPGVGTTKPSNLTLKWFLVKMMSNACGRKMQLVELNMIE